ncbi:hypothetical protein KCP69_22635 [Salmonella enterica subsp. enterica]|nr:hypothetical protein KCP69_22635 [Salmonella enterica subsp. enterica]
MNLNVAWRILTMVISLKPDKVSASPSGVGPVLTPAFCHCSRHRRFVGCDNDSVADLKPTIPSSPLTSLWQNGPFANQNPAGSRTPAEALRFSHQPHYRTSDLRRPARVIPAFISNPFRRPVR